MGASIYRCPATDGAADPAVILDRPRGLWRMFYTARRPDDPVPPSRWIHGTPIGMAVSADGRTWRHDGWVEGLDAPGDEPGANTHWAPEVVEADGLYHMFLSYVPGIPAAFAGVPRSIVHLTSPDLLAWTRVGPLALSSERVIDACVFRCPDGLWRLWYKDEARGSSTWAAVSPDLFGWRVEGLVLPGEPDAPGHEGPNVFPLGGQIWMIADEWRGQAVWRSQDAKSWTRQGLIGDRPGTDPEDRRFVRHADVVPVRGDEAVMVYFTHPAWDEAASAAPTDPASRATAVHAGRLWVEAGELRFDRDASPPLPPAQRRAKRGPPRP